MKHAASSIPRLSALAISCTLGVACAAETTNDSVDVAAADTAHGASVVAHRVFVPNTDESDDSPSLPNEAAALTAAASFLGVIHDRLERADCARELGVAEAQVRQRYDGCRAFAKPDTHPFDPTTYTPAVTCEIGFCSTVDLANSEIVRFDGRHALATTSSAALHAGSKVIVVLDMDSLSTLLSSESLDQGPSVDRGIAALVPHLYVRTDGGAFTEITGLPSLDHARGDAISFLGYRDAEAFPARSITVPMGSDRLEMYMRFERFTYHQTHEPVHDTSPPRRVDARTTDGFVSNFGKNFSLPVR